MTAIYMLRLLFLVFYGESRDKQLQERAHDPGLTMRIAMIVLGVLSIIGGFLAWPGSYNLVEKWLQPVFQRYPVNGPSQTVTLPFYWTSLLCTLTITVIGVFIAWRVYFVRRPSPQRVGAAASPMYQLLYHRYYVDELYDLLFVRPIKFAGRSIYRYVERDVIDAAVIGVGAVVRMTSNRVRNIQTGYVRSYALAILFGAVLLLGFYVVGGR
jgi:NADH-quinone oxidoreductase subunit L